MNKQILEDRLIDFAALILMLPIILKNYANPAAGK
jgi:hypothetical protein